MRWSASSPAADRRATYSTPTDVLLVWDDNAWQDYLWWQQQDRKILKRINLLLQDITGLPDLECVDPCLDLAGVDE
jgi:toxin YoeB